MSVLIILVGGGVALVILGALFVAFAVSSVFPVVVVVIVFKLLMALFEAKPRSNDHDGS